MSEQQSPTPPPGWYPDPTGQMRWWDGQAWGQASSSPANLPATQAPVAGGTDEKTLATLAQVLAIFTGFLGPLVIYLMVKPDQPFAKHHAAEALNFQITVTIAYIVSFIAIFFIIGILMLPLVMIGALVLEIIASVAANKGEWYRFPVNLRLVSGAQG